MRCIRQRDLLLCISCLQEKFPTLRRLSKAVFNLRIKKRSLGNYMTINATLVPIDKFYLKSVFRLIKIGHILFFSVERVQINTWLGGHLKNIVSDKSLIKIVLKFVTSCVKIFFFKSYDLQNDQKYAE